MATGTADRSKAPDETALSEMLGKTAAHWNALLRHLASTVPGLVCEWKFYGPKYGWQLKVSSKRRAVLYLVPEQGAFVAAMALNDAAVEVMRASDLPEPIVREITTAKRYPEGRPARVRVTSRVHAGTVRRLLAIKLAS